MSQNTERSNRQYACQMARKYLGGDISKYSLLDSFPDRSADRELAVLYRALTNEPKVSWFFGTTKEKHKTYVLEIYKIIDRLENLTIGKVDWQELKDKVYNLDGSLRDIYVENTTKNDWQIWADFVNKNYKTSFHIYETEVTDEKVDLNKIFEYWNGVHDNCSTATVFLGDIKVKAHFFSDQEIENDITPIEFNSIEDHNELVDYMKGLSKVVNKQVILTAENMREVIFISVDKDEVKINLDQYR